MSWLNLTILTLFAVIKSQGFQSSFTSLLIQEKRVISSSSTALLQTPIVDDWKILKSGELVGIVRNHPVLADGDVIKTSPLENPEDAMIMKVVKTASGSTYKLGNPSIIQLRANSKLSEPALDEKSLKQALAKAKLQYDLNGLIIGNGSYLLAGKPRKTTSGKSTMYICYRNDGNGLPLSGPPLCAKISSNIEALRRESKNYERVSGGGSFVQIYQFYGRAGDNRQLVTQSAIIMERGIQDLKTYIEENGPLQGRALRDCAIAAIQCLQAIHSANMVWTDMKPENFVVTDTISKVTIKGIDLESAIPIGESPVDYSPDACPPEFAEAFLSGDAAYFELQYNYDIWSLGMLLYELSTGRNYFRGKSPAEITKLLRDPDFVPNTSEVPDEKLRDLISSCLQPKPEQRLSINSILLHSYFLTTGFGPFSF